MNACRALETSRQVLSEAEDRIRDIANADTAATAEARCSDFLGSLTHELRHEVSAVLHQVELMGLVTIDEPTRRRSMAAIASNADRLMAVIDDLSALERVARGEITTTCSSIEIGELIGSALLDREPHVDWTGPVCVPSEPWNAHTDPVIVDRIIGRVLDRYHRDDTESVSASARRSADRFIDVVFTIGAEPPPPSTPYRSATMDDGVSMYLARRSAELVDGDFGPLAGSHTGSYLLRLPEAAARTPQVTMQD